MTTVQNDTSTKQWEETDILTDTEEPCTLIVWNDEVNTFQWVIETLMEVCGHSYEQAEQCSYIIHFQGDHFHAVAMYHVVRCERAGWGIGCRNNKPRLPRFQYIRSKVAVAGFKPRICNGLEAEGLPPIIHGVPGVAHIEVNMVNGFNLQEIRLFGHRA